MKKLPEKLEINGVIYTINEHLSHGTYTVSYNPPDNSENQSPPEVHNKLYYEYLVSVGIETHNDSRTPKEQAYDDMYERLEGAREFFPGIDLALKQIKI